VKIKSARTQGQTLSPQAQTVFKQGLIFLQNSQLDLAASCFESVTQKYPRHAESIQFLGVIEYQLQNVEEAIELIKKAISIQPTNPIFHSNLGYALRDLGAPEDALQAYGRAIELKPDYALAHCNRATVLQELGKLEQALQGYDQAILFDPQSAKAKTFKATVLLLQGDFERGWETYESRLQITKPVSGSSGPASGPQRWFGKVPITNRSILLHAEQGLGDTIQFCRYGAKLAELGARVILEVQPPLNAALANAPGVDELISIGQRRPVVDFYCPLMSLPYAFHTNLENIPLAHRYLAAEPLKASTWQATLGAHKKPRVGLVWAGGLRPDQPDLRGTNTRRNFPLRLFDRIGHLNCAFFSLQKGQAAERELTDLTQSDWAGPQISDMTGQLADFSDTAALIANLDLVISVDTSTAHLAAALGKPVWLMNRFDSCWRWLLERRDSPWYASVKIYRQPSPGDWNSVIQAIAIDLADFERNFSANIR
jgi:Flp pilus assembly protein TadD